MKRILPLFLILALLLCGCNSQPVPDAAAPTQQADTPAAESSTGLDTSNMFTDRDLAGSYDESKSARIQLNGSAASCDSDAVQISGSTVTITDEGTYILSGTLEDGMIIVDAPKDAKTQIVFNGVSIHSQTSAPIYVRQADKVFITLAADTENTLSNGGTFTAIDENSIDATVFSKEDLTVNGSGQLSITSPAGHGIVSKDELSITGGRIDISSASHGVDGKDNVCITGADLTIISGKDGIHAENDDDTTLGFVYIESGSFAITAEGDGISAGATMQIAGGTFDIVTGGGSANAQSQTSENWGDFMGGMPGGMGGGRPGGGMGGNPRGGFMGAFPEETTAEDSTSIKAIKAGTALAISGGSFTIDSADDAIHSNADLTVSGGTFEIATGDDGFHADAALTILAGTINITKSYEGLEGLSIDFQGGNTSIVSSDDGLNAAGGTDQSGFGGHRGNDMFAADDNSFIRICGGTLDIQASGDGIDSNGSLTISDGTVTVCGPTTGDTAVLDFASTGVITGGTFIGTGAFQMAQTFSSSQQGVLALQVGSQTAGTQISLADAQGNILLSCVPALDYAIVILSCPEMVTGESYTVSIGDLTETFEAG